MVEDIKCPNCGQTTKWQNNEHRPFCSERCKLIDFGAWASESYKIPTQDASANNDTSDPEH